MTRVPTGPNHDARHRLVSASIAFVVVLAVGGVLAATTVNGDAARSRHDDPTFAVRSAAAAAPSANPTSSDGSAPAPTDPTTTEPALMQPEDPPANPHANVPVVHIGQIEIPKIGLVHPIFEGIWLTVINHGPGHWPGTPLPGGWGNVVFAGHRVTHSHPFRNIDQLVVGDEITFRMDDGGVFIYRVTGSEIVVPSETRIVDQRPGRTLTLFACHPPGSASHRYVVHAELESAPASTSTSTPAPGSTPAPAPG